MTGTALNDSQEGTLLKIIDDFFRVFSFTSYASVSQVKNNMWKLNYGIDFSMTGLNYRVCHLFIWTLRFR